ncbi:N-6 DNA methylase [Candidatus Pseudothioglobus singularis]|nr:N-6 DNA methylase [Candidatus Pseudothioglobus singularis]
MEITQIEQNIKNIFNSFSEDEFIYDLLIAYGRPKSSITRLRDGNLNLSDIDGEVSWKKQLFFKPEFEADLHLTITNIVQSIKNDQRFVIVTDFETLLARDTKTHDTLDIDLIDLPQHYDFFLPWAGMEKKLYEDENSADVKAAEKMAKLFDKIKVDNPDDSPEFVHGLNVFLSRLLFCFFSEDTNIFKENQMTSNISSHTQDDGSDLQSYLKALFEVLNTPEETRHAIPEYLNDFPYVNGELFSKSHEVPKFTKKSRKLIIDMGSLDWSLINPDIFGSMFQAVVDEGERGHLGMHYTSVPNIMKVIKPLFLDDLYEEFEKSIGQYKRLLRLADRLSKIKIFDPACGSGNFLIIAFKELKRLEMKIFKELNSFSFSQITPSQFYGIEIDDFAHQLAKLSLWLTEHQMNVEFLNEFNRVNPTLPLKNAGNISCANATRINWEIVCPKETNDEIYILGNPPYLGSRNQDEKQKEDMKFIFKNNYKSLDYIALWFYLGAKYIKSSNAKYAFVSTNSISQGEQVSLLWPRVLNKSIEIFFAYQSFKWSNNAKHNAGVIIVVIGLSNLSNKAKKLYIDNREISVDNINPYLTSGKTFYINKRKKQLSGLPIMGYGNMPLEGGFLRFRENEKIELEENNQSIAKYIRNVIGGEELLKGLNRYCLWIEDEELQEAKRNINISERIEQVKNFRINGGEVAKTLVNRSHQFRYRNEPINNQLVIPCTSSESRNYIPCSFFDKSFISLNSVQVINDSEPWIFGVINSIMHMTWMRAVAGRLKTDYRYSSALVYNTFPFPDISPKKKEELNQHVFKILGEREKYPEKTLSQLYDPIKMPDGLKRAHHENDLAIELCFRIEPFKNDEERLEYLFKLYEEMIAKEEAM